MRRRYTRFALLAACLGLLPAGPVRPLFGGTPAPPGPVVERLTAAGFENVRVLAGEGWLEVRYENRLHRYELVGIGRAAGLAADGLDDSTAVILVPLTRGVPVAALSAPAGAWRDFLAGRSGEAEFRARLQVGTPGRAGARPDSAGAPVSDSGRPVNRSYGRFDAAIRPLAELQLGIADNPFQTAFWLAPELTVSPARTLFVTLQARVEIQDEFDEFVAPVHPGRNTLSAGLRLPGAIDLAASAGYFPGYRYGFVAEAGRILDRQGLFEARLSGDLSGFMKFLENGTVPYSDLSAWSGVATVIARAPWRDLELSASAGHFLSGDDGVRVDLVRRFGEVELGFFGIDTDAGEVGGFRFSVPLPVRHYSRPRAFRPTTVPSFPFEYREDVGNVGLRVNQYDNLNRYRRGLYPTVVRNNLRAIRGEPSESSGPGERRGPGEITEARPGLGGTTGLINTPTANVAAEGALHAGYSHIDEAWSYEGRGTLDNEYYYVTVGLLPNLETSIRATVLPGETLIEEVPVDAVDRMGSLRYRLVPGKGWPTLAAGVDDIRGTRRFHSLYLVGSKGFEPSFTPLSAEVSLGFGLQTLAAPRYLLDGAFGGVQLRMTPWATVLAEHDSEKWNGGIRFLLFSRLSAQVVLLHFDTLSGGASWTHHF